MFIGVNTNIRYQEKVFHIQTEDGGLDGHTLTTILFKNGAILSSKKTSYIDIPKSPDYNDIVKKMMQEQHKQMARDLVSGKFESPRNIATGEKSETEKKQDSEEKKTLKKGALAAEDLKKESLSADAQYKSVHQNSLDILILDYLKKKDATRV